MKYAGHKIRSMRHTPGAFKRVPPKLMGQWAAASGAKRHEAAAGADLQGKKVQICKRKREAITPVCCMIG